MQTKEVVKLIMILLYMSAGFAIGFSVKKPTIFQDQISECKLKGGDIYTLYIDFRLPNHAVEGCERVDTKIELN